MKHIFKMTIVVALMATSYFTLSSFIVNKKAKSAVAPYQIVLLQKILLVTIPNGHGRLQILILVMEAMVRFRT